MPKTEIPIEQMTYEQAFSTLEALVLALENDQLALEEAATLYERGQRLALHCAALLEQVELRIHTLQSTAGVPPAKEE
jgi:exodeoxyribonuclease VII small subunit